MPFTGQLGTPNSTLGNIVLGVGLPSAPPVLESAPIVFSQVLPIRGVPWARFLPPFFDPRINPPVPPGSASTPPAYRLNIPGVPWLPHPVPPAITNPVIVPPAAFVLSTGMDVANQGRPLGISIWSVGGRLWWCFAVPAASSASATWSPWDRAIAPLEPGSQDG